MKFLFHLYFAKIRGVLNMTHPKWNSVCTTGYLDDSFVKVMYYKHKWIPYHISMKRIIFLTPLCSYEQEMID